MDKEKNQIYDYFVDVLLLAAYLVLVAGSVVAVLMFAGVLLMTPDGTAHALIVALTKHHESLSEHVQKLESRLKDLECKGECSCQTWAHRLRPDADDFDPTSVDYAEMHK